MSPDTKYIVILYSACNYGSNHEREFFLFLNMWVFFFKYFSILYLATHCLEGRMWLSSLWWPVSSSRGDDHFPFLPNESDEFTEYYLNILSCYFYNRLFFKDISLGGM